jgi:hypothetical protein
MIQILQILIWMALGAVALVIGLGFYSLFRGGEFSKAWSNKLMRLRILVQALAVVLLVGWAVLMSGHHH